MSLMHRPKSRTHTRAKEVRHDDQENEEDAGEKVARAGAHRTAVITAVQSGSSVSGTFVAFDGGGQLSGSVSGDTFDT